VRAGGGREGSEKGNSTLMRFDSASEYKRKKKKQSTRRGLGERLKIRDKQHY
jgi:hypothetical protein